MVSIIQIKLTELLSLTLSLWLSSLVEVFSALRWCSWSISSSLSKRTLSTDIWSWELRSLTWLWWRQKSNKEHRWNHCFCLDSMTLNPFNSTIISQVPESPPSTMMLLYVQVGHISLVDTEKREQCERALSLLTVWDRELPPPGDLWPLLLWSDAGTSRWIWTVPEPAGIPLNKTNILT